ncbi:MAG: GatB/YqeY domain-containing protein [Gammaproteobacteria bacterium]|nr:MAG: GatB/YqeY domain-containing protein [Gammaproteobacteria bacterium]
MKAAMRGGDKPRLGVIRLALAALKQKEVDERIELNNDHITEILTKMVKQRRESISQYENANRQDLADQEKFEISVLQDFLPEAMSEEEVQKIIDDAIAETGASEMKDMKKVMEIVKPKLAGRAEMGSVSKTIKSRLS